MNLVLTACISMVIFVTHGRDQKTLFRFNCQTWKEIRSLHVSLPLFTTLLSSWNKTKLNCIKISDNMALKNLLYAKYALSLWEETTKMSVNH